MQTAGGGQQHISNTWPIQIFEIFSIPQFQTPLSSPACILLRSVVTGSRAIVINIQINPICDFFVQSDLIFIKLYPNRTEQPQLLLAD